MENKMIIAICIFCPMTGTEDIVSIIKKKTMANEVENRFLRLLDDTLRITKLTSPFSNVDNHLLSPYIVIYYLFLFIFFVFESVSSVRVLVKSDFQILTSLQNRLSQNNFQISKFFSLC